MVGTNKPLHDLIPPNQLLEGAQSLLERDDMHSMRAVVLECFAALETYVDHKLFERLMDVAPPDIVQFLKTKTRMDFDARMKTLIPAALWKPIPKALEQKYSSARKTRHEVVHAGRRVTKPQAKSVFRTILEILNHLEPDIGLANALRRLKDRVESSDLDVASETGPIDATLEFFRDAPIEVGGWMEPNRTDRSVAIGPEFVFIFDGRVVGVNVRTIMGTTEEVARDFNASIAASGDYLNRSHSSYTDWALVVYTNAILPPELDGVGYSQEHSTMTVGIQLPRHP